MWAGLGSWFSLEQRVTCRQPRGPSLVPVPDRSHPSLTPNLLPFQKSLCFHIHVSQDSPVPVWFSETLGDQPVTFTPELGGWVGPVLLWSNGPSRPPRQEKAELLDQRRLLRLKRLLGTRRPEEAAGGPRAHPVSVEVPVYLAGGDNRDLFPHGSRSWGSAIRCRRVGS